MVNTLHQSSMSNRSAVGDKVYVECATSMGAGSTGVSEIKEVRDRFDEETGEKYQQIRLDGFGWADRRDGRFLDDWLFYIEKFY